MCSSDLQEYQGLVPAGFTADGRFVYGANMRNQMFLVVGDQESEGYSSLLTTIDTSTPGFKPLLVNTPLPPPAALVGNHIAFTALTGGTMNAIVVDGKSLQREGASRVTFSSDAAHFGFTFGRLPTARTVNVDGKDLPGSVVAFQQAGLGRYRPRAEFVFSADGNHVSYFDQQPGNSSGVYVDGKLAQVFPGTQPQNLTFTPDGTQAYGYDPDGFAEGRPLDKADLDPLFPDNPVMVIHNSNHGAVLNSCALALAGYDASTPDPAGGVHPREMRAVRRHRLRRHRLGHRGGPVLVRHPLPRQLRAAPARHRAVPPQHAGDRAVHLDRQPHAATGDDDDVLLLFPRDAVLGLHLPDHEHAQIGRAHV